MNIEIVSRSPVLHLKLDGRLDAPGGGELQTLLVEEVDSSVHLLLLDFEHIDFVSSAGLRVLLDWTKKLKEQQGCLALCRVSEYCRDILKITGFEEFVSLYVTAEEALTEFQSQQATEDQPNWTAAQEVTVEGGTLRQLRLSAQPCRVELLGSVQEVMHAHLTEHHIHSESFENMPYAIGIGGLGDQPEVFMPALGPMMTAKGSLYYHAADGHDQADMLVADEHSRQMIIRSAAHAVLHGGFSDLVRWQPAPGQQATLGMAVQNLCKLFADRDDHHGVLGFVIACQCPAIYGTAFRKAPLQAQQPANGKTIDHPSNAEKWLICDQSPRHQQVTALIVGLVADLEHDLSDYDEALLESLFFISPARIGNRSHLALLHGAVFNAMELPDDPKGIEPIVQQINSEGRFQDMRIFKENTQIGDTLAAVAPIQEIILNTSTPDAGRYDSTPSLTATKARMMAYYKGCKMP